MSTYGLVAFSLDPAGPARHHEPRVDRGGSWSSSARRWAAYRDWDNPDDRYNSVGFRLARTIA